MMPTKVNFHHFKLQEDPKSKRRLQDAFGNNWLYCGRWNGHYGFQCSPLHNPYTSNQNTNFATYHPNPIEKFKDQLISRLKKGEPSLLTVFSQINNDTALVCWCDPAYCHVDVIIDVWDMIDSGKLNLLSISEPEPQKRKSSIYCLPVYRPWAFFMAGGQHIPVGLFSPLPELKRIENRSWEPSKKWLDSYFAIYATKKEDNQAYTWVEDRFNCLLPRSGWGDGGNLVAIARLIDYVDRSSLHKLSEWQKKWFCGPIGWVFDDVIPIDPIPYKGHQGVRQIKGNTLKLVRDAYRNAL